MRNSSIKAFSLGIIAGSFLTAGLLHAIPAKAATPQLPFVVIDGSLICAALDDQPGEDTILQIGATLIGEGLTAFQAGEAIYLSVAQLCPRYLLIVTEFAGQPA